MSVRPAIVGGMLWIGEVPEKTTEQDLRQAMALLHESATVLSVTIPKDEVYGRACGWATVRFRSDEEAAEVLVRSRSSMIAMSSLQWPLIIEAMAPKEQHEPSFLLTLQTEGTGLRSGLHHPPHFVAQHTLEFDLCKQWIEMDLLHSAQRDYLRSNQWKERHKLMSEIRPEHEREKWLIGSREHVCARSRLRRSLYVLGLDKRITKEKVVELFTEIGDNPVERCTLCVQGQSARASVRFKDVRGALRALDIYRNQVRSELSNATVRHMIENSTLLIYDFDPKVTNEMLKDAFAQFGHVKRAQVAVSKDFRGRVCSRGRGVIEFERHSVASDVLAILSQNMFCMQFGSRPLQVRPYVSGALLKRWSSKSPADDIQRHGKVVLIDQFSEQFENFVEMRQLQQTQRGVKLTLKGIQREKRREIEEAQRRRLEEEGAVLRQLTERHRERCRGQERDAKAFAAGSLSQGPVSVVARGGSHSFADDGAHGMQVDGVGHLGGGGPEGSVRAGSLLHALGSEPDSWGHRYEGRRPLSPTHVPGCHGGSKSWVDTSSDRRAGAHGTCDALSATAVAPAAIDMLAPPGAKIFNVYDRVRQQGVEHAGDGQWCGQVLCAFT